MHVIFNSLFYFIIFSGRDVKLKILLDAARPGLNHTNYNIFFQPGITWPKILIINIFILARASPSGIT